MPSLPTVHVLSAGHAHLRVRSHYYNILRVCMMPTPVFAIHEYVVEDGTGDEVVITASDFESLRHSHPPVCHAGSTRTRTGARGGSLLLALEAGRLLATMPRADRIVVFSDDPKMRVEFESLGITVVSPELCHSHDQWWAQHERSLLISLPEEKNEACGMAEVTDMTLAHQRMDEEQQAFAKMHAEVQYKLQAELDEARKHKEELQRIVDAMRATATQSSTTVCTSVNVGATKEASLPGVSGTTTADEEAHAPKVSDATAEEKEASPKVSHASVEGGAPTDASVEAKEASRTTVVEGDAPAEASVAAKEAPDTGAVGEDAPAEASVAAKEAPGTGAVGEDVPAEASVAAKEAPGTGAVREDAPADAPVAAKEAPSASAVEKEEAPKETSGAAAVEKEEAPPEVKCNAVAVASGGVSSDAQEAGASYGSNHGNDGAEEEDEEDVEDEETKRMRLELELRERANKEAARMKKEAQRAKKEADRAKKDEAHMAEDR